MLAPSFGSLESQKPTSMGTSIRVRRPDVAIRVLFLSVLAVSHLVSSDELTFVVGETSSLQVVPTIQVTDSPGQKPGRTVLCERVYIYGRPRLRNLDKYAHSLKLRAAHNDSSIRGKIIEVCFHRNSSREIGMCPQGRWEKVSKGSLVETISPFDRKILDVRIAGSSSVTLEVSAEEEFYLYRIIFLIVGVVLLGLASTLSKSLVFYYSSAMTVGIILVVLVVLFQGMKLLPTGRKSSLAFFLYSSLVGLGGFLFRYIPGLIQSLLVEMGISEDMYTPLAIFLGAFLSLTGAWLGFWLVRKLVLTEDGSIDLSTSLFVSWSIRILAVVMILQSSVDPLLAGGAAICGIIVSSFVKKIMRLKFLRLLFKKLLKLLNRSWQGICDTDLSPVRESLQKYIHKETEDSEFVRPGSNHVRFATLSGGIRRPRHNPPSESDTFPSSFHRTPDRRKLKKEEWEEFTRKSTKKAVDELVSSPDFGQWAAANSDRITVTPRKGSSSASPASARRWRWFLWFSGTGLALG